MCRYGPMDPAQRVTGPVATHGGGVSRGVPAALPHPRLPATGSCGQRNRQTAVYGGMNNDFLSLAIKSGDGK